MTARIVQKFGGTSVATLERILDCARRSLALAQSGHHVAVVTSAMAGQTNRLIGMANDLLALSEGTHGVVQTSGPYVPPRGAGNLAHERELDQLVSTGETVSAALFAMAVQALGGGAVSLAGHQLGLTTDRRFTRARVTGVQRARLEHELAAGKIVVCTGFQGIDPEGNITTLGRGGSDTSAVALAAALEATCEILTDVDGVFTTDPRLVTNARKLDRLSYEEMIELAGVGAKVLHISSIEYAMRYKVPIHVRSSLHTEEGTWIVAEDPSMDDNLVTGVALDRNEAKVSVLGAPDVPGVVASIFAPLRDDGIVVDMIIQNAARDGRADVTFTVQRGDLERALRRFSGLSFAGEPAQVVADPDICKISIVGVGMRTHAGVAARAFEILAAESINIQMVSTSEIKVSVVVAERYGELALRALHDGFGLGDRPSSP